MSTVPLACFTPSLMPEEVLERMCVAREPVLKTLEKRVKKLGRTPSPNHTLLVGPHGVGKTHVISLAYHRCTRLIASQNDPSVRIARLPEAPWTITSYGRFLAAILDRVFPAATRNTDESTLEAQLRDALRTYGPIVVFAENVDHIFVALGEDGQQKLRSFLQTETRILIIGSATRLDRSLSESDSPFFGFFDTIRLTPFSPEVAREMLTSLARESDNSQLAEYVSTPDAMAKIHTITHLTGGSPRVWAILGCALNTADFDDLNTLLLTRIDAFTPYYQEQLAHLSPLQRLVIAELVAANHPLPVKDLAERVGSEQRSVAKAVSDLSERAWIKPVSTMFTELLDQRRSYYDLADPLTRLTLQLKDPTSSSLPLAISFLARWFGATHTDNASTLDFLGQVEDALSTASSGDAEPVMALPSAVREAIELKACELAGMSLVRADLLEKALSGVSSLRQGTAAEWLARAERLDQDLQSPQSRLTLVRWLATLGHFDEAEAALGTISSTKEAQEGARALSDAHQGRD